MIGEGIRSTLVRVARWVGSHELGTLVTVLLLGAAIWGFAEIADEVIQGDTDVFDRAVMLAMRDTADPTQPWGPRWLHEAARDITALGGLGVMALIGLHAVLFLLLQGRLATMWLLIASLAGGAVVSAGLKAVFARPRPDLVPHAVYVYDPSFPSGHSIMAAVTYLTLGAVLARTQKRKRAKALLLWTAVLVTALVGASRVYLGVHWPTDVLAGWTAGAGWALLCWLVASKLQHEGKIEQEDPPTEPPSPSRPPDQTSTIVTTSSSPAKSAAFLV